MTTIIVDTENSSALVRAGHDCRAGSTDGREP